MLCTFREDLLSRNTGLSPDRSARFRSPWLIVASIMRPSPTFFYLLNALDAGQAREDAQGWI